MLASDVQGSVSGVRISDVLLRVWDRKMDILFVMFIAAGLGFAFSLIATPEYTSTSQIVIENLETRFERSQGDDQSVRPIDETDVTTQVEIIKSRDIASRVLEKLNLIKGEGLVPQDDKKPILERFMLALGASSRESRALREEKRKQQVLDVYNKNLIVYAIPKSKVVSIEFRAHNPKVAAQVAQTVAETFVTYTREVRSLSTGRARNWLAIQIESLKQKVVETEVAAEQFRTQAGLLRGESYTLGAQEISELNRQLTAAQVAKAQADARLNSVRVLLQQNQASTPSLAILDSPLMQKLQEQQAVIKQKYAELSITYLDSHPKILTVKQELAAVSQQIKAEVKKAIERLSQESSVALMRMQSLQQALARLKKETSLSNVQDVKLRSLEREAAANRSLLDIFLQKYSEASSKETLKNQPALARIVSNAQLPLEPSFPLRGPIVAIAAFVGFLVTLSFFFIVEVLKEAYRLEQADKEVKNS